ncbi:MAG: energy coupling factor transporter S component ThiW [Fervidicoccaceae archaeon]
MPVKWSVERKIALALMLSALAVALAPINIPVGPTKAFPWQHMVNVLAGVILGPWWATGMAILIGTVRIALGLGTIFAYPGGIPGALLVGLLALYLEKRGKPTEYAAFIEPVGTAVVGFLLALYVFAPLIGKYEAWMAALVPIWLIWLASTSIGTVVGFAALKLLKTAKLI